MIEIDSTAPDDVVVAVAHGRVSGKDHEDVLVPEIESKLRRHGKIACLYQLAPDFSGFTAEAMWDDLKVGVGHVNGFDKVAIVTDVGWVRDAAKVFGALLPCPVRTFANDHVAEARAWVGA